MKATANSLRPSAGKFIQAGRLRGTLFTFFFTVAGFWIYPGSRWMMTILAAITMMFIHMSIMVFNDFVDREHDTKKKKTLAYKYPQAFFSYWLMLTVLSALLIVLTGLHDWPVAIFLAVVLMVGIGYSFFHHHFLLNSLLVALCGASPVLCGSVNHSPDCNTGLILYAMFFCIVLAREIVNDFKDMAIDSEYKPTVVLLWGPYAARNLAAGLLGLAELIAILTTPFAWLVLIRLLAITTVIASLLKWDMTAQSTPRRILFFDVALAAIMLTLFLQ